MNAVYLKTIWQSKEINIGGIHIPDDYLTPKAEEILIVHEEEQKMESPKMFSKRKKAVSFHGFLYSYSLKFLTIGPHTFPCSSWVEPSKANACMEWGLALKRSSACTNVSIMNLTDMDNDDSTESEHTEEEVLEHTVEEPEIILGEADSETDLESLPSLEEVRSSGLGRTKDSVTDLKRKTSKINRNVKLLQDECTVLCDRLEQRRQEADELDQYCSQLESPNSDRVFIPQDTCRKVKKSVEDAEIKTNALRQNSLVLEEKLNYLRFKVQDEDVGKREKEWQELEERLASGITKDTAEELFDPMSSFQPLPLGPEQIRTRELHRAITVIVASIGNLQYALERSAQEARRESELNVLQEMKAMAGSLEGVRESFLDLDGKCEKDNFLHKEVHRLISHVSSRFDAFLPQWERSQKEQSQILQTIKELQASTDDILSSVKRISLSMNQLRTDMDGLSQLRPLLDDVSKMSLLKIQEAPESVLPGFTRHSSPNLVSTENLKHMLEHAMAPMLEELKNINQPSTCISCQRLQKRNSALEGLMMEKHMRAMVISSDLRLLQDDTLRLQSLLYHQQLKNEGKPILDDIHQKILNLQAQLSILSVNGFMTTPHKQISCPDIKCLVSRAMAENISGL
ncbi:testis-specific serine kinase substrate [Lissotriton helveticus]